jgi:hypothetical protein
VKGRMIEEGVKTGSELGQNKNSQANYIFQLYAKTTIGLVFNLLTFSMMAVFFLSVKSA